MTLENGVIAIRRCSTSLGYYQPFWGGVHIYEGYLFFSSLFALFAYIYIAFSTRNLFADALFSLYDLRHDPITKRHPPCCGV